MAVVNGLSRTLPDAKKPKALENQELLAFCGLF
jgi:hypothetical protein